MTKNEIELLHFLMKEYGQLTVAKQECMLNAIANIMAYWRFNSTDLQLGLIKNHIIKGLNA